MANRYITLANSDDSLSKQFKVVLGSYRVSIRKNQSMQTTIGGKIDMGQGSSLVGHSYVLKVPYTGVGDYGGLSDLETLFRLSDPGAAITDVITLTDHLGNEKPVFFLGELSREPLAYLLDGSLARYMIKVEMMEIPS